MEINVINPQELSVPNAIFEDALSANYLSFKPFFSSFSTGQTGVVANTAQGAAYPSIGWEWTLANLQKWNPVWWAGLIQTASIQTLFPNVGWDVELPEGFQRILLMIDGFSITLGHVKL